MKNNVISQLVPVLCLVVCAVTAIFAYQAGNSGGEEQLASGAQGEIGLLKDDLARTERTLESIRDELANLRAQGGRDAAAGGLDEDAVRRIVAEMTAGRAAAGEAAAFTIESNEAPFDLERSLNKFTSIPDDWDGRQAIWAEITKQGRFKEAIAWFENRAKNASSDPEAQTDLGEAYISQLISGQVSFQEMGKLAAKADKAFDAALEIDETHWRSRFNKAMSLSNAPAFLGRRPEAIKQFEILQSQQQTQPAQPHFAVTQLFLGNMYAQSGRMEEAEASWKKGLEYDPQNKDIQQKIAGLAGGN